MKLATAFLAAPLVFVCTPACADTARDILLDAAYTAPTKTAALLQINRALTAADLAIRNNPADRSAYLQRALAISYRGKLNRDRSDLMTARRGFEAAIAADPRDAEAHMALAGWHLGAVIELGPMMARAALGARTAAGNAALDRSLVLGGRRAAIPALACLERIQLDPGDIAGARKLAEMAMRADASSRFDRLMQKQAAALLDPLRQGNGKAAAALAQRLMPFGRFK